MAAELGPRDIRINAVNPMVTLTPLGSMAWGDSAKSKPVLNRIPIDRFAKPIGVTHVAACLISDYSAMIYGATLPIDGVDVIFIGPMDLSKSLSIPGRFDDPKFKDTVWRISGYVNKSDVNPGIMVANDEAVDWKLREASYSTIPFEVVLHQECRNYLDQVLDAVSPRAPRIVSRRRFRAIRAETTCAQVCRIPLTARGPRTRPAGITRICAYRRRLASRLNALIPGRSGPEIC